MLRDRVVMVTGAACRLGAAIALGLHGKGLNVIIHYHRSEQAAQQLILQLNQQRPNSAWGLCWDLTDIPSLEKCIASAAKHWGRLDYLVNNAAAFFPTPLGTVSYQQWQQLFNTNVSAPFFLCQAAMPYLQKYQGAIVNLVDIHAERPLAQHAVYCSAKAAMVMLTKSLAQDLAPQIRVNGVAPGAILWPSDATEPTGQSIQRMCNKIPLARMGRVEDIAQMVTSLLLESPYVTGQIIAVDGGRSLNQ